MVFGETTPQRSENLANSLRSLQLSTIILLETRDEGVGHAIEDCPVQRFCVLVLLSGQRGPWASRIEKLRDDRPSLGGPEPADVTDGSFEFTGVVRA